MKFTEGVEFVLTRTHSLSEFRDCPRQKGTFVTTSGYTQKSAGGMGNSIWDSPTMDQRSKNTPEKSEELLSDEELEQIADIPLQELLTCMMSQEVALSGRHAELTQSQGNSAMSERPLEDNALNPTCSKDSDEEQKMGIAWAVLQQKRQKRGPMEENNGPKLAGSTQLVTAAEWAFISFAREWNGIVTNATPDHPWQHDTAMIELSCVMLAYEWGNSFGDYTKGLIETNDTVAVRQGGNPFLEGMPWELCVSATFENPSASLYVDKLVRQLTYGGSDYRVWLMRMAWFVRGWLPREATANALLRNVADTLGGVDEAIGLASALFKDSTSFWAYADSFIPPDQFADQYRNRIKEYKTLPVTALQYMFLSIETKCRAKAERIAFDIKMGFVEPVQARGE